MKAPQDQTQADSKLRMQIIDAIGTGGERWVSLEQIDAVEQLIDQRLLELLDELETITQGTVCLYHHAQGERGSGMACGCTTEIDRGSLDSFLEAKRLNLTKERT